MTALSFEVNRCVMLARGADPRDVLSPAAILVMGSTGTGKTHTIKAVADAAGLKLFVFDVSTMTGEGWRGASMSNCLSQVADYQAANPGDICLVLFDEFDKAVRAEPDGGEVASALVHRSRSLSSWKAGRCRLNVIPPRVRPLRRSTSIRLFAFWAAPLWAWMLWCASA